MEDFDLVALGIPKDRIQQFQEEIEDQKGNPHFFLSLAEGLTKKGKLTEAITCYQKALSLQPNISDAWNNLGVIYISQDKLVEAAKHFEKAVLINPIDKSALFNLGLLYSKAGRLLEAVKCQERAIEIAPEHFGAHLSLGSLYGRMQKMEKALFHYEKAAALDASHEGAKHMVQAIKGEKSDKAPAKYVEDLFDSYSKNFEDHLTTKLQYKAPYILAEEIFACVPADTVFSNVLDLGCGTGLMVKTLEPRVQKATGVDLSKKMLDLCYSKRLYSSLVRGDILEYLKKTTDTYDLITAADVFVYYGNVEQIFSLAYEKLAPKGLFAFSVESSEEEGFVLRDSGRFAHSESYIAAISGKFQLLKKLKDIDYRVDSGKYLKGTLYLLQKV